MNNEMALAEDVLIEILIRLPVRSLVRFRCVSKDWCALIRSPKFITSHLKRHCNKEMVLLKRKLPEGNSKRYVLSHHSLDTPEFYADAPSLSVPLFHNLMEKECYGFFGTCNGLVCLAFSDVDSAFAVVLCNPALQEFKVLDPTPLARPEGYTVLGWGFGFDANTNAYKVVQLWGIVKGTELRDFSRVRTELYDSSTNSWRLIGMVPRYVHYPKSNFFFNGACHWETVGNTILSFDLSTEFFKEFEYPKFECYNGTRLLVYNQCLSVLHFKNQYHGVMEIWVMKKYGVKESWTKDLEIGPYIFRNISFIVFEERVVIG